MQFAVEAQLLGERRTEFTSWGFGEKPPSKSVFVKCGNYNCRAGDEMTERAGG